MLSLIELDSDFNEELKILLLVTSGKLDASIELDIAVALEVGLLAGGVLVDSSFAAPPHAVR
ncbi:MAG TPA: hypothetical protein VIM59_11420 [Cellvibrio sp.]